MIVAITRDDMLYITYRNENNEMVTELENNCDFMESLFSGWSFDSMRRLHKSDGDDIIHDDGED